MMNREDTTGGRGLGVTRDEANASVKLVIEREDRDDGSITYHLWDLSGTWIAGFNDDPHELGAKAKFYAELFVRAVNTLQRCNPAKRLPPNPYTTGDRDE